MHINPTVFPEVLLLCPQIFSDDRGYFYEGFHESRYKQNGMVKPFVQDNLSRSCHGVFRGLHYQLGRPQAKLVSVIRGKVFDVVVDVRPRSATFGQWFGEILSDENHWQLYIPEGFAHGFCVLSDEADFLYKCTDYYYPAGEEGIHFADPEIGIKWPLPLADAIVSSKDAILPRLKEVSIDHLPS